MQPYGRDRKTQAIQTLFLSLLFKGKVGEHTLFLLEVGPIGSDSPNIKLLSLLGKAMKVVRLLQMLTRWPGYCSPSVWVMRSFYLLMNIEGGLALGTKT